MSPAELERNFLSLRCWLERCVLPSAAVLVAALWAFRAVTDQTQLLNQNAVIAGFFILYFVLVRGGHTLMIRSLHNDLMRRYEAAYRARLLALPKAVLRRRNLGFTLTAIKRELITEFGYK